MGKDPCNSIKAELDGLTEIVTDHLRESWGAGDKQPGVLVDAMSMVGSSIEELAEITTAMDLKEPLQARP